MKLIVILIFLCFLSCKEKDLISTDSQELQDLLNTQNLESCDKDFMGLKIDNESYCTKSREFKPSLNSEYDKENKSDLLKFWYYFNINSPSHPNWKTIYFIGTVPNINKIGNYKFDNSDYDYNAKINSYSNRTSFIWIDIDDNKNDSWNLTQNQYTIQESIFNITKYSKNMISGKFAIIAKKKGGELLKFTGSFYDLDVK